MPPRSSNLRSQKASQGRSTTPGSPDFNEMWRSKDLSMLSQIPHNLQGWCGCSICGSRKLVKGTVFRQHMWTLHSSLPAEVSPAKRPKLSSTSVATPEPGPSTLSSFSTSAGHSPLIELDPQLTGTDDFSGEVTAGGLEDGYVGEGGGFGSDSGTDTEAVDIPFADERDESEEGLEEMVQRMAGSSLVDIPSRPSPSPSPPLEDAAPVDYTTTLLGRDLSGLEAEDHLAVWPWPLPAYLLPPPCSGSAPNPFAHTSETHQHLPLSSQVLPLLAHTLSGIANIPRRSIELVLHTASLLVAHTRRSMYERFRQWYINMHPEASDERLEQLDESFAPGLSDPSVAPRTAATALKQLRVDDTLIVHPVCKNHDCNHVFLDHTDQKAFSLLPPLCPSCSKPLFSLKGKVDVLHFPRRSLQSELEVLFRVPGVETAIERRKQRKAQRDRLDEASAATTGRIYRQQDDGSAWRSEGDDTDDKDILSLTVNLSIDWANPSSTRAAAASSMGPFLLQVADLPAQLRGAFCCMLIMGITPAPRQPKAQNLWKLLLPLSLELRDAWLNGIWIRTPAFPQGRLIRVHVGCLCCDRPAAVELTGGPYFGAKSTPCLRCIVHCDDLLEPKSWPRRSSHQHIRAVIDQVTTIPLAVREDEERWEQEPPTDPVTGKKKSRVYTQTRRQAVIKSATKVRGNVSALALLPRLDVFGAAIFDPMHSILEGANKTYFFKVLQLGRHEGMTDVEGGEGTRGEGRDGDASGGERSDGGVSDGASTQAGGDSQSDGETPSRFDEGRRILGEMREGGVPTARPPAVIAALERDLSKVARQTRPARKTRMSKGDIEFMQGRMGLTQTPTSIAKLHPHFGTPSAGTPTAHDWRIFSTVHAPLLLPVLFAQRGPRPGRKGNAIFSSDELAAQMMLCEITSLALRPTISERQVDRLESLIAVWLRLVYTLHPSLRKVTNLHVLNHLASDIRSFGPTYGWWCFPGERLNYIVKNTNCSGGSHYQAQVVAMRAVVRSREVVSARSRTLGLNPGNAVEEDVSLAEDVRTVLDGFSHQSASSTLEQVAYMYAELDKRDLDSVGDHLTERVVVRHRGGVRDATINRVTLNKLQSCLRSHGINTSTTASSGITYVSSQVKFWEGIVVNGQRFDCADWLDRTSTTTDPANLLALSASRNSIFEARPEPLRWALRDQNSRSGVLCAVFEHKISVVSEGEVGRGLYGLVRLFKPFTGGDVYGYRTYPSLDVWTWEHQYLDEPLVIALRPEILQALRPLALASLPIDPHNEQGSEMWATIPVHQC